MRLILLYKERREIHLTREKSFDFIYILAVTILFS